MLSARRTVPALHAWLRRLLTACIVVAVAVLATFFLTRFLPGDPVAQLASGMGADAGGLAALRHRLGIDLPLPTQLARYIGHLCHGDWGRSFVTGQPVLAVLRERLPASLELTVAGLIVATLCGLPLGIVAAIRPAGLLARISRWVSTAGIGMPSFVIGLVLVHLFYFRLGWVPEPAGRLDVFATPPVTHTGWLLVDTLWDHDPVQWWDAFRHLLLPAVTMGVFGAAPLLRMTRSAMLAALASDPVRTASSLGLPRWRVLRDYALSQAAAPIITSFGMVAAYLLAANVAVEKVFAWPGIGTYALDAIAASDYPALQGFILCVAIVFACWNLFIDTILVAVDPRLEDTR